MLVETFPELLALSRGQQMLLASELWERAAGQPNDARDEAIHELLNRRLAHFATHPESGGHWNDLKIRVLGTSRT